MEEPVQMPSVGDVIADKYEVEAQPGEGGMGVVLRAQHKVTSKSVAIKVLHSELAQRDEVVQRFRNEALAAGRIDHPNVVNVHDFGLHQGAPFLVMEFMKGHALSDLLEKQTKLSVGAALRIMIPVMRGVAAAHRKGIVHRDLKPDNIFLCEDSEGNPLEPKVLDFGISKLAEAQHDLALTADGMVMGTPFYMSPEQARSSKDVDHRTDIYSLAVIVFELIAGKRPFTAETFSALVIQIATESTPRLDQFEPGVNAELADVVFQAMAKEPTERYQKLADFARALEPFAEGVTFSRRGADWTGSFTPPQGNALDEIVPPRTSTPITPMSASDVEAPPQLPTSGPSKFAIAAGLGFVLVFGGVVAFGLSGSNESEDPAAASQPPATETPTSVEPAAMEAELPQGVPMPEEVAEARAEEEDDQEESTMEATMVAAASMETAMTESRRETRRGSRPATRRQPDPPPAMVVAAVMAPPPAPMEAPMEARMTSTMTRAGSRVQTTIGSLDDF